MDAVVPTDATDTVALSETSTVGPAGVELVAFTGVVAAGCSTFKELIGTVPDKGVVAGGFAGGETDDPPPEHPGSEMASSIDENATLAIADEEIRIEKLLSKAKGDRTDDTSSHALCGLLLGLLASPIVPPGRRSAACNNRCRALDNWVNVRS